MNKLLRVFGMLFGMAGVAIIFFFGWPQPSFQRHVGRAIEDDGTMAKNAEIQERHYRNVSRLGLGLIFVGFFLEFLAEIKSGKPQQSGTHNKKNMPLPIPDDDGTQQ